MEVCASELFTDSQFVLLLCFCPVVATENTTPQENTQPEDDNARPEEQFIQLEQEEETGDDDGNSIPQQQQQQQHVPPPQEDDDGDDDDDMIDIGRPINVDLEKSPADSVRPATDDVFQDDIFRDDDDGANFEPV